MTSVGEVHRFGSYIVIEGMDGSGKTTQRDLLVDDLTKQGKIVEAVSEPGGTPIGDAIRQILKDGELERSPQTDVDLFTIARRELAIQRLSSLLTQNSIVVSDRNWFSTIAYQGFGEDVDIDRILALTEEALGDHFMPDQMVIVNIPVELAEERMRLRGGSSIDYFEKKGSTFLKKVAEGYRWLAEEYSVPMINGEQLVGDVQRDIQRVLDIGYLHLGLN